MLAMFGAVFDVVPGVFGSHLPAGVVLSLAQICSAPGQGVLDVMSIILNTSARPSVR